MSKKQCTLGGEISMSGVGLHTGSSTTMTFKPAEPDTGYRFVRVDLPGSPSVLAVVDNVVEIARGTTIANGEARVYTVEHVLAAMVGMGIDHVLIELDNNEPPVGDGSALPYVEMIQKVGIVEQDAPREELVVTEPIRYFDEQRGTEIVALPNDKYRVTVMVDYNNPALGSQHTGLFDLEREFETEFAPARTFCFLHEVEMLRDQGLIKGGNLDNAIVIVDEDITDAELQAKLKDLGIEENAVLGSSGLLNNKTLRFKNEPARHKLLDMIGDLALIGTRLNAQVLAAQGYLVIMVNPRGSSGYGQAFSQAIWADWGNKDYEDVMAAVDWAIEKGYADPERLGVGGWSYGGILTNYVITKTDRFKGAISGASEVLYRSNYGHDHYQLQWEKELGWPWKNAEAWERISPFNQVENIVTPTLIMGGEVDWNVPINNSEQLYQALKRLGRETQLVVYPGEHHGISRPSFQKDRYERYLGWYNKYVKGLEVKP